MKKRWILMAMGILCVAVLASCTSNADTLPSQSPSASPSTMPTQTATTTVTMMPSAAPTTSTGATTLEDAKRIAQQIDEEVEKLSEINESCVVVADNMAIVGVTFDKEYQGGVTSRMTEMIDARVAAVDKSVTVVHTTDDEKIVAEIKALEEQVDSGDITFSELQTRALEISSTIAGAGTTTAPSSTSSAVGTT